MARRIYRVEFTITFENEIAADSEGEARAILEKVTPNDVLTDTEWLCDPHDFQKEVLASWDEDDEDTEEGA